MEITEVTYSGDKEETRKAPIDRFSIVYIIFTLLGIGNLIPWNFFITATDYFQYKLNDSSPESQKLVSNYPNSQTVAAMVPYALFSMLNLFLTSICGLNFRFHVGNSLTFICLVVTLVMVEINMKSKVFFGITIFTAALLNSASAIFQGAVLGILSYLPPKHVSGYLEGTALAGILASVAKLVVIAGSNDKLASATAYFSIAIAFIAMATAFFLLLPRNPHYAFHLSKSLVEEIEIDETTPLRPDRPNIDTRSADVAMLENHGTADHVDKQPLHATCSAIVDSMKEAGLMGFVAFFTLCVTLSLFPTLFILMDLTDDSSWRKKYFKPVFVFLLFNICDYISRKFAVFFMWPRQNQPKLLLLLCVSRLLIVLLVMFGNQTDKAYFPVLYSHNAIIAILITILGLTNGYFLTTAFMYAPSYASPGNEEKVGVAMGLFVALGLSSGVATSYLLKLIL